MGLLDFFKGGSDRDRFAREVQLALKRQGESRPLHYDASDYAIRIGDDPARPAEVVNLANGLHAWQHTPAAERAAGVERFARALTARADTTRPTQERLANLRPAVRDRAAMEIAVTMQRVEFPGVRTRTAWRPLAADWVVCLAEDTPDSLRLVNDTTLGEFGEPWDALLARAIDNLRLTSADWRPIRERGVVISNMDDAYDTSRILLPELWRGAGLRGRVVAMAPDRAVLMMAPADDAQALETMAALALVRTRDQPRRVSGLAITRDLDDDAASWVELAPPAELAPLFARVARWQRAGAYVDQTELLTKLLEAQGQDVFVANQLLMAPTGAPEGEFESIALWPDGVVALLPECDSVGFSFADKSTYRASWAQVRAAVPELMEATEHFPPRYKVTRTPTREQLLAMGAARR